MDVDEKMDYSMKLTCHTPTAALAMRIRRMTSGSTNAATRLSSSLCSSNKAKTYLRKERKKMKKDDKRGDRLTNEMQAAASRILTRRSSNCSKISFQSGLPSSAGNSIQNKIY